LLNEEAYRVAFDKAASGNLARTLGIDVPDEELVETDDDISRTSELRPPLVLKPTRSFLPTSLGQKHQVVHATSHRQAESALKIMLQHSPVLVQEFFKGSGVGVEFIAHDGEILLDFQHARLHEPPSGGGSSYRKSTLVDPALRHATAKIAKALNYSGVGMVEFLYDFSSRKWVFVEINGRFWGSLPLAVAAGADFPRYLFEMLTDKRKQFPARIKTGVAGRNLLRDCRWLIDTVRHRGLNLWGQLRLAGQLIGEMRYPLTLRSHSDTLVMDDMRPGLVELREAIGTVWQRIRTKSRYFIAQRFPCRQWCQRRFQAALSRHQSILFVCKGNICRSPFAEHYARLRLPQNYDIKSCGYFPKNGRPSPGNAIQAADQLGIDLGPHRSEVLSSELIEAAGVVVIFDEENRQTIRKYFPKAHRKTHALGTFSPTRNTIISDPYGGTADDFRATYESIMGAIDKCATSLDR
ncbi:MAG: hypothetical protein O7G83_09985, partial [Proteobacteria bacterium]|nr:hypothetical protein [Pseudomonadota bacterium]